MKLGICWSEIGAFRCRDPSPVRCAAWALC